MSETSPETGGIHVSFAPLLLVICVSLLGCEGRPRSTASGDDEESATRSDPHVAELDLRGGIPEVGGSSFLSDESPNGFADLLGQLRELDGETETKGVFVRLGHAAVGLARADEVGRALGQLRQERALPVVCHADLLGNGTMLLAARGCTEIWVSPAGAVDSVGIAAQLLFGRSLLERLDVDVDFLQVGKFKGASEPFTRDEASPEARQSLRTALSGIRRAWIDGIEHGRGKSAPDLGVEDGPHTPDAAKQLGLIDEVGFEQPARDRALERAAVDKRVRYFGESGGEHGGVGELVRILSGTRALAVPHVAVVLATGSITVGGGDSPFSSSDGIAERRMSRVLSKLAQDESARAVVLRIDSPGGSALASDLLWRAVMDLRAKKPVVASVGSMAASGGYYIASGASKIVAERTSILGSIGVVAGKLSFARSLAELGVHAEAITAADHDSANRALWGSALSGWDEATRAKVLRSVERTYALFLERIVEGRSMKPEAVSPAAEGRLMAGDDAKSAGLVDEIGGLDRAIRLAIELSGADADITVHVLRPPSGLWGLVAGSDDEGAVAMDLQRRARLHAAQALGAALLPYRAEIEAYAGSFAPLLQGEHVVAALPYALALQ